MCKYPESTPGLLMVWWNRTLRSWSSLIYCVLHFRHFILRSLQSSTISITSCFFNRKAVGLQRRRQGQHMERLIDSCQAKKIRAIHQVWTSWTLREADWEKLRLTVSEKSEHGRTQSPVDELGISWLNRMHPVHCRVFTRKSPTRCCESFQRSRNIWNVRDYSKFQGERTLSAIIKGTFQRASTCITSSITRRGNLGVITQQPGC